MNGKNSGGGQRQLSGKFVTIVTLTVLAALIFAVALFMSLYKPGVEEKPRFPTDTETDFPPDVTTTEGDKPTSVDNYKRKKGYYTFLIAGTDVVSNSTDVLMVASLDTEKNEINIIQIPRDTFVNKEVGGYQTVTRVNSVYAAAYNRSVSAGTRAESARHIAMKDLKSRLETSLCINIDYYALVNTSSFRRIVDAVGGVWFDVPDDMDYDDAEQDLSIHLKKGYQLLDGKAAEGLIRFRSGYAQGDLGRVSVRADFLTAMVKQVKENMTADALLTVRTISGSPVMNPDTGVWSYYVINKSKALDDINRYLNVFSGDIPAKLFDAKGFFTDAGNESHAYINDYYIS